MPTNPVNPRRVADAGGAGGAGVPTTADLPRRAHVSPPPPQSRPTGASKIVLFVIPYVHLGELAPLISSHLTARTAEQGMTVIVHFEGPASRAVIDAARDLRPRLVLSMFSLD